MKDVRKCERREKRTIKRDFDENKLLDSNLLIQLDSTTAFVVSWSVEVRRVHSCSSQRDTKVNKGQKACCRATW